MQIFSELRSAFDGDDVPRKNRALRLAYATIEQFGDLLLVALPFVEDMEADAGFKQGVVKRHVEAIRAAIAKIEHQ